MEAKIYNREGKESGMVTLPESVFGVSWNADLVHQVATSLLSSARKSTAHTKTRGEVRGGGKKPWQQKGTGRARHGSTRSPIWVGGGVTHGPRNDENFTRKVNKKMKRKALYTVISQKVRDHEVFFVDSLSFTAPKTTEAKGVLKNLGAISGLEVLLKKRKNAALITVPEKNRIVEKSFNNIGSVKVEDIRTLNILDLLTAKYLLITAPEKSCAVLARETVSA